MSRDSLGMLSSENALTTKQNKGLSPLIATVLLIAFVIAAAGILSNFIIPFTQETTAETTQRASEEIKCSRANIIVKEAKWNGTETKLSLTIENNGWETLENFKASVLRTNKTVNEVLLAPLTAKITPGGTDILTNSTHVGSCRDIDKVLVRSGTCPVDAQDEIKKADIQNC